jgi:hypothetical protein
MISPSSLSLRSSYAGHTAPHVTATCVGVGQTKIRVEKNTFNRVIVDETARRTPGELAVDVCCRAARTEIADAGGLQFLGSNSSSRWAG